MLIRVYAKSYIQHLKPINAGFNVVAYVYIETDMVPH